MAADAIRVDLLSYSRQSDLVLSRRAAGDEDARSRTEADLLGRLGEVRTHATGRERQQLSEAADRRVQEYLSARRSAEQRSSDVGEVLAGAIGPLQVALGPPRSHAPSHRAISGNARRKTCPRRWSAPRWAPRSRCSSSPRRRSPTGCSSRDRTRAGGCRRRRTPASSPRGTGRRSMQSPRSPRAAAESSVTRSSARWVARRRRDIAEAGTESSGGTTAGALPQIAFLPRDEIAPWTIKKGKGAKLHRRCAVSSCKGACGPTRRPCDAAPSAAHLRESPPAVRKATVDHPRRF
jgi:hypothetical protein